MTELDVGWINQKARLKEEFAILAENDLMYEEDNKEDMYGMLEIKLGKTKEEMHKIIAEL
jgi:hypothetical protein